ncbi:MAG: hypothetical protein F6K58_28040 [Symploca sp. SIO2E9]|nr:hypothetical protein [Symploca sp. SIO2E9]
MNFLPSDSCLLPPAFGGEMGRKNWYRSLFKISQKMGLVPPPSRGNE